jgi:RND family efflux transporter MFP subunit
MHFILANPKRHAVLLAAAILTITGCAEKNPPVEQTPPSIVEVSQAIERPASDYQVFTARTQAVEAVEVKARVTGYLTKILFKDGDLVKEGDILFQIDDRPYKATLDMAKGNLSFAEAALVKNQADYDIGLTLQKQDIGAISVQEMNKRLGSRDESKAAIDKAKASIESAQLNYNWCKVTAPISGRANRHFVDVGNLVSQDQTSLTNIVSLRPIWAYFDVDQNTVLNVQKLISEGKFKSVRDSKIPADMALANDQGFPHLGIIDFISNQIDANTGTLRVRSVYPNENGALAAGLFGRIRVPISSSHTALMVNERAIGTNQGQKYLLTVNDKNEVEYREVDLGQAHDGLREVLASRTITEPGPDGRDIVKQVPVLKATDWIIVDGLQRARPGAKVETRKVDMVTMLSLEKAGK